MSRIKIRESYYNQFLDLQEKHKKKNKDENVAIIILLLIYFMEYFSNPTPMVAINRLPMLTRIKNIDKVKSVTRAIDNALEGKGILAKPLKDFKELNKEHISYINTIISQKQPKIKVKRAKKSRLDELEERASIVETQNKIAIQINANVLMKEYKTWNTQRDDRVRKTVFHQGIDRETVEIHNTFNVSDYIARYPADSSLPYYDRFGCRCYLTFH